MKRSTAVVAAAMGYGPHQRRTASEWLVEWVKWSTYNYYYYNRMMMICGYKVPSWIDTTHGACTVGRNIHDCRRFSTTWINFIYGVRRDDHTLMWNRVNAESVREYDGWAMCHQDAKCKRRGNRSHGVVVVVVEIVMLVVGKTVEASQDLYRIEQWWWTLSNRRSYRHNWE